MYEIGQVVFVVLSKKQQIFPMQVVETVTKKTLQGEEIKYCLQAGSDKTTKIMLDQIEGEIFTSADEARSTLISRATLHINRLVDAAAKKANIWYSDDIKQEVAELPASEPVISFLEQTEAQDIVVLPDGNVARIKFPTNKAV